LPEQPQIEPQLSFKMIPEIAEELATTRDSVRAAGHARPSQRTLVQALIHAAVSKTGEEIETDVLMPYRQAFASEE
jgi:hypothetical protein